MRMTLPILVSSLLCGVAFISSSVAAPQGVRAYLKATHAPRGAQTFAFNRRVSRFWGTIMRSLGAKVRTRRIVQVTNKTLKRFVQDTQKGYVEVIIPANTGHVWFRVGKEVYDFHPKGFRVGQVRPIKGERYGMLAKITPAQERQLKSYLKRLKADGGRELGKYDFHGEKGLHCVTWLMRAPLGEHGESLVQLLGGTRRDGGSMARFARFLLRRANRSVATVALYTDQPTSPSQLRRWAFQLISGAQVRRAHEERFGPTKPKRKR